MPNPHRKYGVYTADLTAIQLVFRDGSQTPLFEDPDTVNRGYELQTTKATLDKRVSKIHFKKEGVGTVENFRAYQLLGLKFEAEDGQIILEQVWDTHSEGKWFEEKLFQHTKREIIIGLKTTKYL